MKCTLSVNTGACLSPKDELAQEYLRIRHVHRMEIARVNYSQAVVDNLSVFVFDTDIKSAYPAAI